MITKYVALDVETGGLDDRVHSLLQVGAVEVLPNLRPGRWAELMVCEPQLVVSPGAMRVNNIDLRQLDPVAHSPDAVACDLGAFFRELCQSDGNIPAIGATPEKAQIVLVNWNVGFDYRFLRRLPLDRYLGDDVRLSYRTIDVNSVCNEFRVGNSELGPLGMTDAAYACGVELDDAFLPDGYTGNPHCGVYDACLALGILYKMRHDTSCNASR